MFHNAVLTGRDLEEGSFVLITSKGRPTIGFTIKTDGVLKIMFYRNGDCFVSEILKDGQYVLLDKEDLLSLVEIHKRW